MPKRVSSFFLSQTVPGSASIAFGYIKTICIVLDGEHICQDFALRADDEAVVLVLGHVNSYANHENTSDVFI